MESIIDFAFLDVLGVLALCMQKPIVVGVWQTETPLKVPIEGTGTLMNAEMPFADVRGGTGSLVVLQRS